MAKRRRQPSRARCLMALLLYLCLHPALALNPDKAFHQYVSDRWSIVEGLPQLSVISIAQDAQGYLWLATQNGVARFDGVRFEVYSLEDHPGLRTSIIERVHVDARQRIWVGGARGLSQIDGSEVRAYNSGELGEITVHALLDDVNGELLVGTALGLFAIRQDTATRIEAIGSPARALLHHDDAVLVGGIGGAWWWDRHQARWLALPEEHANTQINSLVDSPDGPIAASSKGLWWWDGKQWRRPPWGDSLARARVESLFRDGDKQLWIATTAGLYRQFGKGLPSLAENSDLAAQAWIATAFEDREGNLWIGSYTHSLLRLWNGWTRRLSLRDGLRDAFVWSVATDPDGGLWIGTNSGVEHFHQERGFGQLISTRDLPDPAVYHLHASAASELLLGTRGGLIRWRTQAFDLPAAWGELGTRSVRAVIDNADGSRWLGTDKALYLSTDQDQALQRFGPDQGLADPRIRALHLGNQSNLWVGTERGLYFGNAQRFAAAPGPATLEQSFVMSITELRAGRFAVGTLDHGLFIGNERGFRQLSKREGLPFNTSFASIVDQGWLYVSSTEGIYRIDLAQLEQFQRDGERVGVEMLTSTGSRFPGAQPTRCCNGGAQSRVARHAGALWFPTLDGVLAIDPADIKRSPVAPIVAIETLEHDGSVHRPGKELELDGRQRDLAIRYTGIAMQDPTGLRFRYRLRGYDEQWREVGERRIAYYTNLPAQRYRFEVEARSSSGVLSASAAAVDFRMVPPYYRAWWFQLMAGAMVVMLLGQMAWAWRQRQLSREHRLEHLVQQRTLDLDRALQRLRAANQALVVETHTDNLTGLRNRRYLAHFLAEWRRQGSVAALPGHPRRLAFVLLDLDHFKRINDAHGHLAGDEVLCQVAAILQEHAGHDGIAVRWGGEEFMLVLPAESVPQPAEFLERLRRRIAAQAFDLSSGGHVRLTTSLGFAEYPALADGSDLSDWNLAIEMADAGLYAIKTSGRDGWAAITARANTQARDFPSGFANRVHELAAAGVVSIERSEEREPLA